MQQRKADIRRQVRALVTAIPRHERRQKSLAIAHTVAGIEPVRNAGCIMLYYPLDDEVDTRPLIEWLFAAGKRIVLPVTDRAAGIVPAAVGWGLPHPTRLAALAPGMLGVLEPRAGQPVPVADLEVVIVPGRAFDRRGNRLGRGGGYYDRFLASLPAGAAKIGIAFACQLQPLLPAGPLDIRVDLVVTEDGVAAP